MFQKILVPVDLTDRHQRALEIAGQLALQSRGAVTLLHVVELIQGLPMQEEQTFYQRLERKARVHLETLQRGLEKHKIAVTSKVLFGDRALEIIRQSREANADLIVLSSHRIDPNQPAASLGTLSYKIGILAPCPVLLVK
jgi:nucleotide-binding universal stress UspA family protein